MEIYKNGTWVKVFPQFDQRVFVRYDIDIYTIMFSWLKHHFVPNAGNNHRPHFLRNESMRGLTGFVILVEIMVFTGLTFGMSGGFSWTASVLPAVLGDLTNEQRTTAHLAVLTENPELDRIAKLKAEDMANKGYFAHTSPEGLTPWYWFNQVGYEYEYAGENLAIDFTDSHDVTNAWMNSPTHRANIIKSAYTEIGTGVASGTFDGVPTVFVAQVYAKPLVKTVAVVEEQNVAPTVASQTGLEKAASVATSAMKPIEVQKVATGTLAEPTVLGASAVATTSVTESLTPAPSTVQPSLLQKIALSPRRSANAVFGIIALWIIIALCVHIFVKKDTRHVDLVLNGLVLIALIIALCIVNKMLANRTQTTFQSFDAVTTSQQK